MFTAATAAVALTLALGGAPAVASTSAPVAAIGAAPAAAATAPSVRPMIWGSVIKVLTSKQACIAARDFYNTLPLPPVKCLKMGKVWVVVPR